MYFGGLFPPRCDWFYIHFHALASNQTGTTIKTGVIVAFRRQIFLLPSAESMRITQLDGHIG